MAKAPAPEVRATLQSAETMKPTSLPLSFVLFVSFVVPSVRADDGWTLTTADFKRQSANLRSLDDNGATLQIYGQPAPTTIPLDNLLQLERGNATQQVRGAYALYLTTGDRVGGEPVSIANDQLTWRSPAAGELAIPLKDVRGIAK